MSVEAHKKSYHEYTDDSEVQDFVAQAGDDMYTQLAQVLSATRARNQICPS